MQSYYNYLVFWCVIVYQVIVELHLKKLINLYIPTIVKDANFD